jgi:hypothetical protein
MKPILASGMTMILGLVAAQAPRSLPAGAGSGGGEDFTDTFMLDRCTFTTRGRNPFFPLVPGDRRLLEGVDDGELVQVLITTLHETERVDGVRTRVVEEREWIDGDLVEVSRNFFAHCKESGSVFYFGEDVDIYEDGEIVGHEGAWRSGEDGARAGLIMPGLALLGSRYYQEVAPGVALDRGEHLSLSAFVNTPAGNFVGCLFVEETSPLDPPGATSEKVYAPGVGLVQDNEVKLVLLTQGDDDDDDDDDDEDDDD